MYEVLHEGPFRSVSVARAMLMMFCPDKDVQERAKALLCLPAMSELELPAVPGRPAQRLMEKLGMEIEAA